MTNLAFQAKELMHRMNERKIVGGKQDNIKKEYDFNKLGANLKQYRERLSFTQMELAAIIGYSNSHICHIEQNDYIARELKQSISLDMFIKLCNELGCTAEDLLT